MPVIRPFRAIRYAPGTDLAQVTAPAYDVVGPEERGELAAGHPHNIIRVTLCTYRTDDDAGPNKYTRAARRLREWLAGRILVEDDTERLWLYRVDFAFHGAPRTTLGIVGAVPLSPFGADIAPHEWTMPGPKADRLELMRTTRANLEPLWFVAARPLGGVASLGTALEATPPAADVNDAHGTRHRVWAIPEEAAGGIGEAAAGTPFVIADGHHRYETALAYRDERRAADGAGPWDATLGLVVDPVEHPPLLEPIHRLVDTSPEVDAIVGLLDLDPFPGDAAALVAEVAARGPGTIGVLTGGRAFTTASDESPDTAFLARSIIEPSGAAVHYEHDTERFVEAVEKGSTGFVLAPTPLELVLEHALAGKRMPPKSTLFWPKPRSGLLLRDLEP